MAKIGTVHIEIKPVLDEDALEQITQRIADAVTEGVRRGMAFAPPLPPIPPQPTVYPPRTSSTRCL